jgi:hypothetical protein
VGANDKEVLVVCSFNQGISLKIIISVLIKFQVQLKVNCFRPIRTASCPEGILKEYFVECLLSDKSLRIR